MFRADTPAKASSQLQPYRAAAVCDVPLHPPAAAGQLRDHPGCRGRRERDQDGGRRPERQEVPPGAGRGDVEGAEAERPGPAPAGQDPGRGDVEVPGRALVLGPDHPQQLVRGKLLAGGQGRGGAARPGVSHHYSTPHTTLILKVVLTLVRVGPGRKSRPAAQPPGGLAWPVSWRPGLPVSWRPGLAGGPAGVPAAAGRPRTGAADARPPATVRCGDDSGRARRPGRAGDADPLGRRHRRRGRGGSRRSPGRAGGLAWARWPGPRPWPRPRPWPGPGSGPARSRRCGSGSRPAPRSSPRSAGRPG